MTQAVVGCPFNEANLCDDLALCPLHLRHVLCGDAASPSSGARVWQVGKRTLRNTQRFEFREHLTPHEGHQPRPHLAGEL
jgi:hypothetical protein